MVLYNGDLRNYVLHGMVTTRKQLNIMCFMALFVFGLMYGVALSGLGKKWIGWVYPIMVSISGLLATASDEASLVLLVLLLPIYAAGWIHSNLLLTKIKKAGNNRIAEIDSQKTKTASDKLEKALISCLVFGNDELIISILPNPHRFKNVDPELLRVAGEMAYGSEKFSESIIFFDNALANADTRNIRRINTFKKRTQKKIRV